MNLLLSSLLGAAVLSIIVLIFLYLKTAKSLKRYNSIQDVEEYASECQKKSTDALYEFNQTQNDLKSLRDHTEKIKTQVIQYEKVLGNLKTAADLARRIQTDKQRIKRFTATLKGLEQASQLNKYIQNQQQEIAQNKSELDNFSSVIKEARTASEIASQTTYYENYLSQLKADVNAVEEAGQLQEFGFYKPRFDFDNSSSYKRRLDSIRKKQKTMLKEKEACICNTEWEVSGSKREGKKMVNQQIKLMLRAFNGECDAAVNKAKYNNVVSLENRMTKSFEAINKLGETKQVILTTEYLHLKLDELHLSHEYQEKKHEEKEEERRIREIMREEQKVAKEIEKAKEQAEKDEMTKVKALEKAREELALKEGKHTAKLEALVNKLENELQEALDRKAKAIARAQLTRSGHVYVLSNVGTFGEGIYKIGLTRRLEPLERVKELGGASVPFPFDVHAMIYSEDAPALENTLHKHFASRRVNMVNLRREFFQVTLEEIRVAVAKHFGQVTFITEPEAEQYRKTLALRKEIEKEGASPLQIA